MKSIRTSTHFLSANARGGSPTHAEISVHARALWSALGHPQGQDDHIWLSAERTILARTRLREFTKPARTIAEQLDGRFPRKAPHRSETSL